MSKPTPPGKDFDYLNQPTPLLYICGHMCADGTALYGKPEDKDNKKPVLSDLARQGCIAIVFPCGECYDSQAWVYEKTMRKWVRAPVASAPVAGAFPVVARGPPVFVKAPVFRAQQQQQEVEKEKKQAEKHAQLEREIQELEKEKEFLLEQLEKMKSLPK